MVFDKAAIALADVSSYDAIFNKKDINVGAVR
jgi:hypothetical protein